MRRRFFAPFFAVVVALGAGWVWGEDWPRFRGPRGDGVSRDTELPLTWGGPDNENVLWSAELVGEGIASPIVWRDKLFLVCASRKADDHKLGRKETTQYLCCHDVNTGARLWTVTVPPGPWKRGHTNRPGGGFASCTPATDGERVYALYGTSVLTAIDFRGEIVWRRELTPHKYDVEMATSPVLFENMVIVFCGMQGGSRLVAFERASGEIVWDRDLADTGYGHNTPLILPGDAPQMILMGAGLGSAKNAIQSFNPRTGERRWWCAGKGETASPVLANGLVYCDSGRGGQATMVDPGGSGDVTKTHVKWTANVPQGLSSPLVVGEHVYRLHDNGTFSCWNAATGAKVYQHRVSELSSFWASPVADAQGRVCLASAGTSLVIAPGPEFRVLATNKLGDPNHASPALAAGKMYLAGGQRLFAIGRK